MTQRVEAMIALARNGERALRRRRGPRGGRLPRLAAARQLRPAGRARVRDHATTPTAASPAPGSGILADEERSAYAQPVPLVASCREALRKLAHERRAADRRQGQRALAGAPPRADGLRRRAAGHAGRRDRRRGAPARPVHDQGLRRARVRDAGAAPQAAARARGRGPDRGLARLQGRGRAVRHVPEGRAVRRAGRRPAPRGRRAAARSRAPTACACSAAAPPTAAAPRSSSRSRATATARCSSSACASCSSAASTPTTSRPSTCSARARACACTSSCTRRTGCRRSRTPSSSARSSSSPARGTTRCATRWSSATAPPARGCCSRSGPRYLPEHYKGYTAPATGAMDIALLEQLAEDGPFVVSLQPLRQAHPRRALQARAEGRAGRRAADARGPRAARDRGDLDAAAWATTRRGCRSSACSGRTASRSTSTTLGDRVAELLAAVHRGDAETDNLNRLVITAGLDRRQVAILRAYRKYRQRVGSRFTESYQNDVLVANSAVTAKLVRYFELRFDPDLETDEAAESALRDEILRRPRRGRLARPRPHPAQPADGDRRDAAHERLQRRTARRSRSSCARPTCRRCRSRRRAFEIYVYSPDVEGIHLRGGADRPRRPALVGPPGLPHRGLRADARAADQERGDRARGRQGRLLHQGAAATVRASTTSPSSARCCRSPTTWSTARSCIRERVRVRDGDDTYLVVAADKGTATFSDTANRGLAGVRLLARRRVRLRRLGGLRPQGARDHRQGRVGVGQAPLQGARGRHPGRRVHRRRHRRHVAATCSATGCCCREQIRLVAAYDHRHIFIDPRPGRGGRLRGAQAAVRAAALVVGRLRARADLRGRRRLPAHGEVDPAVAAGARGARASTEDVAARRPR